MASLQNAIVHLGTSLSKLSTNDDKNRADPLEPGSPMPLPLRRLCCANHSISEDRSCPNEATQTCSGCFLVRYCSKECQTAHWRSHKRGITHVSDINVENNEGVEGICDKNLSLAFIATGDLRNVVRTINGLPENYSGTIEIVLNDINPIAVCRNLIMLSILGVIEDVEEAAEHALHIWYSVFLPFSYQTRIAPHLARAPTLQSFDGTPARLTSSTTTYVRWSLDSIRFLYMQLSRKDVDSAVARDALNSTMNAPERVDYRERQYASLRPSHRVAFDTWRRSGLLLPFGDINDRVSIPNRWLFSPMGDILLNDGSSPLQGWDYNEVVKAGRAHGTTDDDLMGGLLFYVKDQLVEFSQRIRRFKINIYSYDQDARDLPSMLKRDTTSPQSFDRIEVSNIVDKNYVGVSLLSDWGRLLSKNNPHAAVVGHFMNWTTWKKSGEVSSSMAPKGAVDRAMKEMGACKHVGAPTRPSLASHDPTLLKMSSSLQIFYDTSVAFQEYLKEEKADMIARKVGIKCRRINKIVPHRCFAQLGTVPNTLPYIDSSDRWYRVTSLSDSTFCERFVEWEKVATDV